MIKITMNIDGMKCGMCESHINDIVRKASNVKKVTSSHTKNQTIIIADGNVDDEMIKMEIEKQGYRVLSVDKEPYEKKSFFSFLKK